MRVGSGPEPAAATATNPPPRHRRTDLDPGGLLEQEEEPGLRRGGPGGLAACYMDSLATLQVPAIGYGIRYECGVFDHTIRRDVRGVNPRALAP